MGNSGLDPDARMWSYDGLGNKVYKDNYTKPYTGIELEKVLVILMEECGELIHACSKILRHGITDERLKNLTQETGDVRVLIQILIAEDLLKEEEINNRSSFKRLKLIERGYINK